MGFLEVAAACQVPKTEWSFIIQCPKCTLNNEGTEDLSSGGVALAGIASDSYRNAYFFCNLEYMISDNVGNHIF